MANLPLPGDPLVTMNGTIAPIEGDELETKEYSSREILPRVTQFVPAYRMGLRDTPEKDHQEQTLAAAVVALRLLGLDTSDIATMFKTGMHNIQEILEKPATQITFEKMFLSIINAKADHISGRIASYADKAVTTVVNLMEGDDKVPAIVKLKAAQDILDRSGTNAEQLFGVNNKLNQEDELKITFVSKGSDEEKISVSLKRK